MTGTINIPRTKDQILSIVSQALNDVYIERDQRPSRSINFYNELISLLTVLSTDLQIRNLPKLDQDWYFSMEITTRKASLLIKHIRTMDSDFIEYDEAFPLIEKSVPLITVEEFADKNGCKPVSVRQWIRRGKLRDVIKNGNEWMIPKLLDPPTRGYKAVTYYTNGEFIAFPPEFNCMNSHPKKIFIAPTDETGKYMILVDGLSLNPIKQRLYSEEERIQIESILLSNPKITNDGSKIGVWPKINERNTIMPVILSGGMRKYASN